MPFHQLPSQLEASVGSLKLPTLDYHTWYWFPAAWQQPDTCKSHLTLNIPGGGCFKYFCDFHPKNWGRWTEFDFRIIFFKWVGEKPPTRYTSGQVSSRPKTRVFGARRLVASWFFGVPWGPPKISGKSRLVKYYFICPDVHGFLFLKVSLQIRFILNSFTLFWFI